MNRRWSADSSTNETTADRPSVAAGQLAEPRVVEAHRHLGREVLELVAGQPELGEDDQVGAAARGPRARSSWCRARFSSSAPSRGAIWASAMRIVPHAPEHTRRLDSMVTATPAGARLPGTRGPMRPVRSRPAPDSPDREA